MTFYAGDEFADDDVTSGPLTEEFELEPADFAPDRQAIQDEYDAMYPHGESGR